MQEISPWALWGPESRVYWMLPPPGPASADDVWRARGDGSNASRPNLPARDAGRRAIWSTWTKHSILKFLGGMLVVECVNCWLRLLRKAWWKLPFKSRSQRCEAAARPTNPALNPANTRTKPFLCFYGTCCLFDFTSCWLPVCLTPLPHHRLRAGRRVDDLADPTLDCIITKLQALPLINYNSLRVTNKVRKKVA